MPKIVAGRLCRPEHSVNCIKSGVVLTPLAISVLEDNPEIIGRWQASAPTGRLSHPEKIAQLALFLASDESSHITGQALAVDGGAEIYSHFHLY